MGRGWKNEINTEAVKVTAWLVTYGDKTSREFRTERGMESFARKVAGEVSEISRDNFDTRPGAIIQGWCEERRAEMQGKWTGVTQIRPDRLVPDRTEVWSEIRIGSETVFVLE